MENRRFYRISLGEPKPLINEDLDCLSETVSVKYIDVKGREEHEAILKDENKMLALGLDPYYERITYLKRWGGWLRNETNKL